MTLPFQPNVASLDSLEPLTTLDIQSLLPIGNTLSIDSNWLNSGTLGQTYGAIPAGGLYTTNSGTSSQYTNADLIFGPSHQPKVNISTNGIKMEEECDILIGNFSLKESLERIEKQLGILRVNPELEKDWEELKELGERYREIERTIREKLDVWKILKNE